MHQLQIVDDDHVDVVPHLRLAGLEHQSKLIHDRRVIDEDRGLAKWPQCV